MAASLPKTSYFKLVDIWLLFCIFSTFLIIVFHILIDVLLHETKKRNSIETNESNIMSPAPEKVFLPSTSQVPVHSQHHQQKPHYQWHLQQQHQQENLLLQKPTVGHKDGEVPEDMRNPDLPTDDMTYRKRSLVHKPWKLRISIRSMERFARVFMVVVFLIFNLVYWMISYTG